MKGAVWTKTPDGRWMAHLGGRGHSVRLHQLKPGGTFYRDIGGGSSKSRRALGTCDKAEALERGKLILAELLRQPAKTDEENGTVTLRSLWDRYRTLNADWLDNKATSRRDDERRAKVLLGFFGEGYDVTRLSENEQRRYEVARRQGFTLPDGEGVRPAKQATVWADVVLLHAMLRWGATKYRHPSGRPLLPTNPLAGVKNKKETTPTRPVANEERYASLVAALDELANDPKQSFPEKWRLLGLFLAVLNATGRRLSAVRHLRWSDVNHEAKEVTWRAQYDKKGREATLPISDRLAEVLRKAHQERGCPEDGWLFPALKDSAKPVDKRVLSDWMAVAEQRAKLPKLKGGVFHPFRRKFASDRQGEPVKQVMVLGGWADQETMQTCYVQVTAEQLRALVNKQ